MNLNVGSAGGGIKPDSYDLEGASSQREAQRANAQ